VPEIVEAPPQYSPSRAYDASRPDHPAVDHQTRGSEGALLIRVRLSEKRLAAADGDKLDPPSAGLLAPVSRKPP
jgi:hypothetical protein